jgi:hypothetical protein
LLIFDAPVIAQLKDEDLGSELSFKLYSTPSELSASTVTEQDNHPYPAMSWTANSSTLSTHQNMGEHLKPDSLSESGGENTKAQNPLDFSETSEEEHNLTVEQLSNE